jgi:hypothetical protein
VAVVAESVLTRHQILILNRRRKRAPNLRVSDRIIAGLCTLLMHPSRVLRSEPILRYENLRTLSSNSALAASLYEGRKKNGNTPTAVIAVAARGGGRTGAGLTSHQRISLRGGILYLFHFRS